MNLPADRSQSLDIAEAVAPGVARVRPAVFRTLGATAQAAAPAAPPPMPMPMAGTGTATATATRTRARGPATAPQPAVSAELEQQLAPLRAITRELVGRGMPAALVAELLAEIVAAYGNQVLRSEEDARLALVELLLERLTGDPLIPAGAPPAGAYLISGPPGSGKSVLIAHLALAAARAGQAEIVLVNTEGQRIGAAAQMNALGTVFGCRVEHLYTPQELRALHARCGPQTLLLVEAAGWSPSAGLETQRQAWAWQLPGGRTVVCTPATSQAEDLLDLVAAARQTARDPIAALSRIGHTRNVVPVLGALALHRQPVGIVVPAPNLLEPAPAPELATIVRTAIRGVTPHKRKGRVLC